MVQLCKVLSEKIKRNYDNLYFTNRLYRQDANELNMENINIT